MDKEKTINTAGALWLAQMVLPMSDGTRIILTLALAALVGRMAWTWMRPRWARYPATVAALAVLALIVIPR